MYIANHFFQACLHRIVFLLVVWTFSSSTFSNLWAQTTTDSPLVFAGSLDKEPQVLFVSLEPGLWIAYDTGQGVLYKVWQGAVQNSPHERDLLVFNGSPAVDGLVLAEQSEKENWHIIRNGVVSSPIVRFKGYRLDGRQVTLVYELETNRGQKVLVEERPTWSYSSDRRPTLRRSFLVFNASPDIQIGLNIHASKLESQQDLLTEGYFHRFREKWHSYFWGRALDIQGRLILDQEKATSVSVTFSPNSVKSSQTVTGDPGVFTRLQSIGIDDSSDIELFLQRRADHEGGISVKVFGIGEPINQLARLAPGQLPSYNDVISRIDLSEGSQFGGLDFYFITQLSGYLNIASSGVYIFRILADDGVRLTIADSVLIERDGLQAAEPSEEVGIYLDTGVHSIEIDHFQSTGKKQLTIEWQPPWREEFNILQEPVLSTRRESQRFSSPGRKYLLRRDLDSTLSVERIEVNERHPSLEIGDLDTEFEGVVTGLDYTIDGRLVLSTWDGDGKVWVVEGNLEDSKVVTSREIARGLNRPMGLRVIENELYVLQQHELTHLVDRDGNGLIDEYRVAASGWELSTDYQELAFGLEHRDEDFYGALGMPVDREGAILIEDIHHRGIVIRIDQEGNVEQVNSGLHLPNGLSAGDENILAVADQRNRWFSDSRVWFEPLYKQKGDDVREIQAGSVWLPSLYTEPTQPFFVDQGEFRGQWLVGFADSPKMSRVFVEQVGGVIQGCVFPFSSALPFPVNRIVKTSRNSFLASGVYERSSEGRSSPLRSSLQRITVGEELAFEMQAVRLVEQGFEVQFTEPVDTAMVLEEGAIQLFQWPNSETRIDRRRRRGQSTRIEIRSIEVLSDQKTIRLEMVGLQPGHVIYFNLDRSIRSSSGRELWSNEAWYSLNNLPSAISEVTRASDAPR